MALPASVAHPGESIEAGEIRETRYGIEADMLPEESFYLVCAYGVDDAGETVARRVVGKTASYVRAARDIRALRGGDAPSGTEAA